MSNLPERYQPYATPAGQTTPHLPAPHAIGGAVELYDERQPVVYIPSADNPSLMVAVERRYVQVMQPTPARDLTPLPLIDPIASRMMGGGIGGGALAAGVGWGAAQVISAAAAASGAALFWLAVITLACKMPAISGGRGGQRIHNEHHTHVTQKWFGNTDVRN